MVASSAETIYRVITIKRGPITFVAVDGGMGDNLEVALFDQRFEAGIANRLDASEGESVTVVGRHCQRAGTSWSTAYHSMRPESTISSSCRQRAHIATQCPTITTEIDAYLLCSLRPKRQVLSSDERRGTILPRVMSHERQLSPGVPPSGGRSWPSLGACGSSRTCGYPQSWFPDLDCSGARVVLRVRPKALAPRVGMSMSA